MLAHHRRAALEAFRVPVLRLATFLVHRVEADVSPLRDLEKQPAHHALTLRLHLCVKGAIELLTTRLVLRAELLVNLRCHLVHTELDDRHVRGRRFKVVMKLGTRQRELRFRQRLEAAAEADEQQIALMSQHLHGRRSARVWNGQRTVGIVGHPLNVSRRLRAQTVPPDAVHQVEHAPPFERLRDKRVMHLADISRNRVSAIRYSVTGIRAQLPAWLLARERASPFPSWARAASGRANRANPRESRRPSE